MSEVCFNVSGHKIQLILSLSGKQSIVHDNKTISEKGSSLTPTSKHYFKVSEDGKMSSYEVVFKAKFSGVVEYSVQRNNVLVKKGTLSTFTPGLMRISFFSIGLALFLNTISLIFIPQFREVFLQSLLNYIDVGINFLFSIAFLGLGISLKRLLLRNLRFVTTVLWIRVGIMIFGSLSLIFRYLQEGIILSNIWVIALRLGYIWLFWFLLNNCEALAQEFKSQSS
ncbi:hypothetical protein Osc7112_2257 [Oscillatoria nigro-viridis PCC 7112]|uniref:Uncharacterized protein n=1 Tax=Phormidium nigroviride PCC 7112 TaxID=179408 RepID=K9VF29_9CYAN|nr:hypothetical protein [Oscillatoria nigro-viridis]AFZ06713.1 hypothetical protein Osc7112_2257 [Oscillatoria nigro-viridis PCC 7112]